MSLELTPVAFVVIPVSLILLFFRTAWLLPWAIYLSIFQAAAVVNLSLGEFAFGLQPGFLAAGLFLLAAVVQLVRSRSFAIPQPVRRTYSMLVIFGGLAALSALTLPHLFQGVEVFPPRSGVRLSSAAPLQAVSTNISQTLYLLFLIGLSIVVSILASRGGVSRTHLRVLQWAGLTVALIGAYQLTALGLGLPYPSDVLNSNPSYAQGFNQVIAGSIPRLSSTLTEPSVAGYHLVGFFALTSWLVLAGTGVAGSIATAILTGTALLLTTSTSGLFAFLFVVVLFVVRIARTRPDLRRKLLLGGGSMVLATLVVLGVWGFLSDGPFFASIARLLDEVFLDKVQSQSFSDRFGVDSASVGIVAETAGIGAGWGSTRASSLLPNILSNTGVWGVALLGLFAFRTVTLYRTALRREDASDADRSVLMGLGAAVVSMLVASLIAMPDVTHLLFWFVLAMCIGQATWILSPNRSDVRSKTSGRGHATAPLGQGEVS